MNKMSQKSLILALFIALNGCKQNSQKQVEHQLKQVSFTETDTQTMHIDTSFQYEKRTGQSGNYEYNYDVFGVDQNGNEVTGNVNVQGKKGSGILIDSENKEIQVDVEWTGHGKLKAMDKNNREYNLEVE